MSAARCVFISRRVDVQPIAVRDGITVKSPVKAHLKDGSTVVYANGVNVSDGALKGPGVRYDITLKQSTVVDSVPLDRVVGMESFRTAVNGAQTAIVSTLASVGAFLGSVVLAVAIFGSCPTVYSEGEVEEAELFSSSIAPLFEGRDVDRLRAQPDSNGMLRLELRNEAMETHYINHLQILEVRHSPGEMVLPDSSGRPIIVGAVRAPAAIVDRNGYDVRETLAAADGRFYSTDQRTIDAATRTSMDDWIDIDADVAPGATQTTLVFRLRNSLLSTVLLYDVMLGRSGAGAIDWLGDGLTRISTAVELGRWHQRRAGLHISVWQDGGYREVSRVPDSGPISWHDVAATIPVPPGDRTARVRLSFVADHWRIDRVGLASTVRDSTPRIVAVTEVTGADGKVDPNALDSVRAADQRYLQTSPGQRFVARFATGASPADGSRTFLLSSQGYYTEWIRGEWIQKASAPEPFEPTDDALLVALRKWSTTREAFERRFLQARVPVH